ncbi:3,4-dihydroxy-2-butanone-4-phosphate synthase [Nocardia aurea]|uniref:3,4-dihydroxy-2-butanone-4-phosphate synthase n=1 Tax=Nocardia aurea TaxID=2144174 RepID=UPI0033A5F63A
MSGPAAVEFAVEAVRSGRMVIVVAGEDDSATGNLVLGAGHVSAEAVNFMATRGRGLIRVAMSAARLDALGIPPADTTATGPARDTFRVSVDVAAATTRGISARGRAETIRALVDPAATERDFTRPGYVFPVGCREGGLLAAVGESAVRSRVAAPAPPVAVTAQPEGVASWVGAATVPPPAVGLHADAAVELLVAAGMEPAAVLCEICGVDGELAELPELLELGAAHDIPVIGIAELIEYRRRELCRVQRAGEARIPLEAGQFRAIGYVDGTGREHIALVHGDLARAEAPLARVQSECLLGDVFGSRRCECRDSLRRSLALIAETGDGVLVYLRGPDDVVSRTPATCPRASPDAAARNALVHSDIRSAGDILTDLGVHAVRLLVDSADTVDLPADIAVVERVDIVTDAPSDADGAGRLSEARAVRHTGFGGAAASRTAVDGVAVGGTAANGTVVNGTVPTGRAATGTSVNGLAVNGTLVNGTGIDTVTRTTVGAVNRVGSAT